MAVYLETAVWALLVWLVEFWVMRRLVFVLGEGSPPLLRIKTCALSGVFLVGCSSNLS